MKKSVPAETEEFVVVDSIHSVEGTLCVDIFRRVDGSFGFEEWRRDPEAGRWFAIGGYGQNIYTGAAEAKTAAASAIAWFADIEKETGFAS